MSNSDSRWLWSRTSSILSSLRIRILWFWRSSASRSYGFWHIVGVLITKHNLFRKLDHLLLFKAAQMASSWTTNTLRNGHWITWYMTLHTVMQRASKSAIMLIDEFKQWEWLNAFCMVEFVAVRGWAFSQHAWLGIRSCWASCVNWFFGNIIFV